jgi:hypothetical protein
MNIFRIRGGISFEKKSGFPLNTFSKRRPIFAFDRLTFWYAQKHEASNHKKHIRFDRKNTKIWSDIRPVLYPNLSIRSNPKIANSAQIFFKKNPRNGFHKNRNSWYDLSKNPIPILLLFPGISPIYDHYTLFYDRYRSFRMNVLDHYMITSDQVRAMASKGYGTLPRAFSGPAPPPL